MNIPKWEFITIRCDGKEYLQYYNCNKCDNRCEIRIGVYDNLPKQCPKKD
jgi:hypothetical protein